MTDTYVLVHGAWHTGAELEPVAQHIRQAGHTVHCPTLAGNRPGDNRATCNLNDAISSLVDFLTTHNLQNVRLMGHSYVGMFDAMNAADPHNLALPPPVWREVFINDADLATANAAYAKLNPQPYKTFADKIALKTELAAMPIGKSYLNFQQDTALPHSLPWHPRLSEKLGLFRLVEASGSHEVCFTNPALLAQKVIEAGRD